LVATRFGDRVKRFATFNEPSIFSLFSRSLGKRDRSSEDNLHRAIHHVNLAHGAAVDVLREKVRGASIGCVHNYQPCWPSSKSEADAAAAARLGTYWNNAFPDPVSSWSMPRLIAAVVVASISFGAVSVFAQSPSQKSRSPGEIAAVSRLLAQRKESCRLEAKEQKLTFLKRRKYVRECMKKTS